MNISIKKLTTRLPGAVISLFLIVSLLFSPIVSANELQNQPAKRISFSNAVEATLQKSAAALDKAAVALFQNLDKSNNFSVKVHSHFYDSRIRRYFISISGEATFGGRFPYKFKGDQFVLTGDREVSFDFNLSQIKQSRDGINFNFAGAITVSMDRLAYRMIQVIPHLAASGALSPAFELLTEFLQKLNIGILSEAISETFRSFSTVAFTKAATELISGAGKNHKVGQLIKDTVKDGSILSFLAIQIMRCSSISLVSVAGASLGATVGSILAPGAGSVVGAFLGSQILTIVAKMIIYEVSAEMPMRRNLRRMLLSYQILQKNPSDDPARIEYDSSMAKIEIKIKKEFDSERFSLFEALLKEIDQLAADERIAVVPLLKNLQSALRFKVTNDGDWYYARKFYLLKQYVDKWNLNKHVVFTVE